MHIIILYIPVYYNTILLLYSRHPNVEERTAIVSKLKEGHETVSYTHIIKFMSCSIIHHYGYDILDGTV